ncbi:aa3-type cytochrome oxidase subunit III [Kineococcus gypseus]|uniref:aa3-type cytochrome oxidase subunit III n=1 Tax=Kineococcus gypseus TaxID=1637102 RepID=UPI003D7DA208
MASAQAVQSSTPSPARGSVNRPNIVSVGVIVWLASELMFFAGLFAMYFTIRSVAPQLWEAGSGTGPEVLNVPFSTANTVILVISSFWCQFGVFAAERFQPRRRGRLWQVGTWGMQEWFVLTYVFGAIFVTGQVFEYAELAVEGVTIASDAYGSVFILTTGFHGIHVLGGLVAFLMVIGRSFAAKRFGHQEATSAIVVSYYWHFVDVVWIGLFTVIYILR